MYNAGTLWVLGSYSDNVSVWGNDIGEGEKLGTVGVDDTVVLLPAPFNTYYGVLYAQVFVVRTGVVGWVALDQWFKPVGPN